MEILDLVKLTNSIYKLTLLFPKKEPLRYKIREVATSFLEEAIFLKKRGFNYQKLQEKWEVLSNFLELAKYQNWVQKEKILEIENRYLEFLQQLSFLDRDKNFLESQKETINLKVRKVQKEEQKKPIKPPEPEPKGFQSKEPQVSQKLYSPAESKALSFLPNTDWSELSSRQRNILKIMLEKKEIKIGELSKFFPNKSRRTLLRDLDFLLAKSLISKKGNGRGVFYRIEPQAINVTLGRA